MCIMIVTLSAKLFWGYTIEFPDSLLTLPLEEQQEQVIKRAKSELIAIFKQHNLQVLVDEVHLMNLHLHGPLQVGTNYACDHPHSNTC